MLLRLVQILPDRRFGRRISIKNNYINSQCWLLDNLKYYRVALPLDLLRCPTMRSLGAWRICRPLHFVLLAVSRTASGRGVTSGTLRSLVQKSFSITRRELGTPMVFRVLCGAYDKLIQFCSVIQCNTFSYNASFYPQTRRFRYNFRFESCPLSKSAQRCLSSCFPCLISFCRARSNRVPWVRL